MNAEPRIADGWLNIARRIDSPNFDARPDFVAVEVVVLHHISLPPRVYGGDAVERLFTNQISPDDPALAEVASLRVSAHFFIRRDGEIVQFVSALDRAWHAGVSCWRGREQVNDFSLGIEIEGDAETGYTVAQYETLQLLLTAIRSAFGVEAITTHAEIAFGRKIDPGPKFDLALVLKAL